MPLERQSRGADPRDYRTVASISDVASATRLNCSGPISEMLATTERIHGDQEGIGDGRVQVVNTHRSVLRSFPEVRQRNFEMGGTV